MDPSLLNPEDTINILLFMTNPIKAEEPPKPSWSARIANVRSVKVQPRQTVAEQTGLGMFYLGISHSGWNVYWFGIVAILLFTIGTLLGARSGRLIVFPLLQVALLIALMVFSFSSADIIVSAIIEGKTQPLIAWLAIGLHSLLVLYLVWPFVRRLRLRNHISNTTNSA